jgi:hypothetical protein
VRRISAARPFAFAVGTPGSDEGLVPFPLVVRQAVVAVDPLPVREPTAATFATSVPLLLPRQRPSLRSPLEDKWLLTRIHELHSANYAVGDHPR